jgi:hypothetical protein
MNLPFNFQLVVNRAGICAKHQGSNQDMVALISHKELVREIVKENLVSHRDLVQETEY